MMKKEIATDVVIVVLNISLSNGHSTLYVNHINCSHGVNRIIRNASGLGLHKSTLTGLELVHSSHKCAELVLISSFAVPIVLFGAHQFA